MDMAYRIVYGPEPKPKRKGIKKWIAPLCGAVLAALLLTGAGEPVKEWLLPGDPEVTATALEGLVQGIREGEDLGDAVEAFCREIVENAQIS